MPLTLSKSMIVNLIPGLMMVTPWLYLLAAEAGALGDYAGKLTTLINTGILFIAVVIGLILENLLTFVEVYVLDIWSKKRAGEEGAKKIEQCWRAYLTTEFESPPVAMEYIGRLVTTMYFELSMAIAVPVTWYGIIAIAREQVALPWCEKVSLCSWLGTFNPWAELGVALGVFVVFVAFAGITHQVVIKTREQLIDDYEKKKAAEKLDNFDLTGGRVCVLEQLLLELAAKAGPLKTATPLAAVVTP